MPGQGFLDPMVIPVCWLNISWYWHSCMFGTWNACPDAVLNIFYHQWPVNCRSFMCYAFFNPKWPSWVFLTSHDGESQGWQFLYSLIWFHFPLSFCHKKFLYCWSAGSKSCTHVGHPLWIICFNHNNVSSSDLVSWILSSYILLALTCFLIQLIDIQDMSMPVMCISDGRPDKQSTSSFDFSFCCFAVKSYRRQWTMIIWSIGPASTIEQFLIVSKGFRSISRVKCWV